MATFSQDPWRGKSKWCIDCLYHFNNQSVQEQIKVCTTFLYTRTRERGVKVGLVVWEKVRVPCFWG